jgi:uncharacterized integral membrane protein
MGERQIFQPLTREDRVTVVLYRTGIVLSAVLLVLAAYLSAASTVVSGPGFVSDLLIYGLYAAVGMSVFFIHLYVSTFHRYLKYFYAVGVACLAVLIALGRGSPSAGLAQGAFGPLLLLPLSGCLGFVTAKEAFCFRLIEGYILAMLMPFFLLLSAVGALPGKALSSGMVVIAALFLLFTLRKVFMPIAYDIGDKSAYR